MSYCISKDMGTGKPPAFFGGISNGVAKWVPFGDDVAVYLTETGAQKVIDAYDDLEGCITLPYAEPVDISNKSYVKKKSTENTDFPDTVSPE